MSVRLLADDDRGNEVQAAGASSNGAVRYALAAWARWCATGTTSQPGSNPLVRVTSGSRRRLCHLSTSELKEPSDCGKP